MAHDDDFVDVSQLRWKLSQIRQCVPKRDKPVAPDRFDTESLLILDIAETEYLRDEWASIAETYRTLAEVAIEALTRLEQQNAKMRALIQNMSDELVLRKSK